MPKRHHSGPCVRRRTRRRRGRRTRRPSRRPPVSPSVLPAALPSIMPATPPSVIPAVFRGNPQAVIVAAGGTSKTAGFPINDVGNDSRRALSFRSCCRAVVFRAHWPARFLQACPLLPSVIHTVFSGNPQTVIVAAGGTSKTAGFPINDVGNDSRRALSFRSCFWRFGRPSRSLGLRRVEEARDWRPRSIRLLAS